MPARRSIVAGGLLVACSSAPPAPTPIAGPARPDAAVVMPTPPVPTLITEADYQLPVVTTPTPSECRAARTTRKPAKPPAPQKQKFYDFMPIPVFPVRRGPVIADRPYVGFEDTSGDIRAVLFKRNAEVRACWRWASARGALETSLEVQLTIDPSGATRDPSVTSSESRDDELVACIREVLAPTIQTSQRAREARITAQLTFRRVEQPPWKKLPSRPKAPVAMRAPKPTVTMVCPPPTSTTDDMRLPFPLIVTDFDEPRRIPQKRLESACIRAEREVDKVALRIALRSNQGAFNACYADALQRIPALTGELKASFTFESDGYGRDIKVEGVGDAPLHACFTTALEQLWIYPVEVTKVVKSIVPFALSPVPPRTEDPAALLETNDVDAATALWVSRLRAPHTPLDGCRAHVGILRAMIVAAPWLDDDRVRGAVANLTRNAVALPPELARVCLEDDMANWLPTYVRLQGGLPLPPPPASGSAMRHVDRYEAVLPLAPYLAWGVYLRWYHADRLLTTSRAAEGRQRLENLISDPDATGLDVDKVRVRYIDDECMYMGDRSRGAID